MKHVKTIPTDEELLKLHGLLKQATEGDPTPADHPSEQPFLAVNGKSELAEPLIPLAGLFELSCFATQREPRRVLGTLRRERRSPRPRTSTSTWFKP